MNGTNEANEDSHFVSATFANNYYKIIYLSNSFLKKDKIIYCQSKKKQLKRRIL